MPQAAFARSRRALALTCWLPLAALAVVEASVRGLEGWGAWAAAPAFLLPLVLSLAIAGAGVVQCLGELRAGSLAPSSVFVTAVAATPLLWLLIRRHVV